MLAIPGLQAQNDEKQARVRKCESNPFSIFTYPAKLKAHWTFLGDDINILLIPANTITGQGAIRRFLL